MIKMHEKVRQRKVERRLHIPFLSSIQSFVNILSIILEKLENTRKRLNDRKEEDLEWMLSDSLSWGLAIEIWNEKDEGPR